MIYLIHGNDQAKARRRFHAVVNSLVSKGKGSELFLLTSSDTPAELEAMWRGSSLFSPKYVVACDKALENADLREAVQKHLNEIAQADNALIMLEEEVESGLLTAITKLAFKVESFQKTEIDKKQNTFALTDAWAERNKKKCWVEYQKAIRVGLSEEEIFWKLVWQTKNLLMVKLAKDKSKLGMKPYPLQKAEQNAKRYELAELRERLSRLTDVYHQARRGGPEIGSKLEQLILES